MHHKEKTSPGEHYVNIRGVKLWYYIQGKGPILLLQPGGAGWGGDATPYIETLKPLEELRTMVYLEPRGIGRSQRLNEPAAYSLEEYVEDIELLRKYFELPKIAIAAHSHGGFVALKYALKYPKKVEDLVLIDTTPIIFLGNYNSWLRKRKGYKEASSALKKLQNNKSLSADEKERATLKILLPVIHFYDFEKVASKVNYFLTNMIVSAKPHHYFNNNEALEYDLRESIRHINAPTLIITGDDDMPHIVLGSKILHEQIPNANLVVIGNCGHWPMIEAPKAFFKAVITFLSK
ncbi:MAG: alpha/beta hydrolase [Candidatus Heimdallarchaeota archaeon]|nr:MAG: alpha/beta hydrolase [Candidatus Heimdallarchaeota archaeon]